MSNQIAQLKVPSNSAGGGTIEVPAPTGIAQPFREGGEAAGRVFTQTAFDWIFFIAILTAVLFIMWSGIQWMTSGGSPDRIASAKKRLMFAIIGLVIVLSSFLIVRVVLTTIGGDSDKFFSPFGGLATPAP